MPAMADNSADSELFELIAFLGDATRKDVSFTSF